MRPKKKDATSARDSTAPKPFVFVLMPFDASFNDVYELGIKSACEEAGTYSERLDDQIFHEDMLQRIYNQIAKADLVVADMSGRNANVFYEVGYAHALDKKVILVTRKAADIPFDLKHYPHIVYKGRIAELKKELVRRLTWFLGQEKSSVTHPGSKLIAYIDRADLASAPGIIRQHSFGIFTLFLKLDIHNSEEGMIRNEVFRIGLISPDGFGENLGRDRAEGEPTTTIIALPDNRRLHLVDREYAIAPGGWEQIRVTTSTRGNLDATEKTYSWAFAIRVFSSGGTRDLPFRLRVKPER